MEFGYFADIYEYCTILSASGMDVQYVGTGTGDSAAGQVVDGVRVTAIPSKIGYFNIIKQMAEITDTVQPDIVHNFNFRGCGLLPILARKNRARWIMDVRSRYVGNNRGHSRLHFLRNRLTWLDTIPYDRILIIAEPLRRMLFPSFRKIDLIPLGANRRRFNPRRREDVRAAVRNEYGIHENAPVLLYAGVVHPKRRIEDIIDAFYLIHKSNPGIYFFFVGGSENPEFLNNIKSRAGDRRLNGSIIFTGRLPYYDIHKYYAAADIGISYTPVGTPFELQPSTKLVEYMMSGLLSVSNDTGMSRMYIRDNENGFLCEDGAEGIAAGLQRAIAALDNPDAIICSARDSVAEYDWETIVTKRLIPFYEKILK